MAQNEPQRKETPPGPSPNSPLLLFDISVEAANLSDWRIESNRKNRFGSENRIKSNRNFFARIGMLYCLLLDHSAVVLTEVDAHCDKLSGPARQTIDIE